MVPSFLRRVRLAGLVAMTLAGALVTLTAQPRVGLSQPVPTEIKIGGTISLSGPFQPIVGPFKKLADAWADRVNARGGIFLKSYNKSLPIRFIYYDDKSEPTTALSFYERMATEDKVDLFIGPFSSGLNNAAVQAALTNKIPYFVPEGNDAVIYATPNPWRATGLAPAESEYNRLVALLDKVKGVKTFAILARDNLHEQASAKAFGENLKAKGFQVVYQDIAPTATKDFASIIQKIKEAKPDVLVVESIAPPFTIGFLKQARELGVASKGMIVGHMPGAVIKAMEKSAENMVSMLYFFEGDSPDHKEYFEICKAAGFEPWQFSESGIRYRTYRRIEEALKRAGSLDKEAVRKAMYEADFDMFGEEHMKVDARGYGTDVPYPVEVRGGKMISLWPVDKGATTYQWFNSGW